MPYLNGFDVSINTLNLSNSWSEPIMWDGVVIDEEQRTLTCRIIAETEKHFYVSWKCKKGLMESRGELFVDGVSAGHQIIQKEFLKKKKGKGAEFSAASIRSKRGKPELLTFNDHSVAHQSMKGSEEDFDMVSELENTAIVNRGVGEVRLVINRIDRVAKPDDNLINITESGIQSSNRPQTEKKLLHVATFIFKYQQPNPLTNDDMYEQQTISHSETDTQNTLESEVSCFKETMISQEYASESEEANKVLHLARVAEIDNEIEMVQKQLNELHAKKANLQIKKKKRPTPTGRRVRRPAFIINAEKDAKASHKRELKEASIALSRRERRIANWETREAANATKLVEEREHTCIT